MTSWGLFVSAGLSALAAVACVVGCRHGGVRAWIVLAAMLAAMCAMLTPWGSGVVPALLAAALLGLVLWTVAARHGGRRHPEEHERRTRTRQSIDLAAMALLLVLTPALGHTGTPPTEHGGHLGTGWSPAVVVVVVLAAWAAALAVTGWQDLGRRAASPVRVRTAGPAARAESRWALTGSALMLAAMVAMTATLHPPLVA